MEVNLPRASATDKSGAGERRVIGYRSPWDDTEPVTAYERRWKRLAGKPATEGGFFVPPKQAEDVSDYGHTARESV